MSKISCFKGSKLEAKFNKKIEQGIDEYIAAREVLVEAYGILNEQSNTLRKSLDLPAQDLIVEEVIVEDIVPQVVELEEEVDNTLKINSEGKLLAPNGKSSNLTEEQYKLVRTPEFKAWFGDWENNPQNASKVVDENGEPLVVYHGTASGGFSEFKNNKPIFFTDSKGVADSYQEKQAEGISQTYGVFLTVKNLEIVNGGGASFSNIPVIEDTMTSKQVKLTTNGIFESIFGYRFPKIVTDKKGTEKTDGVLIKNIYDNLLGNILVKSSDIYVVPSSSQIKSATEIKGTTSTETNDIRYLKSVTPINSTQNFTGDAEYLTGEFISDFWAKVLKAKQKDNADWRNYYSHFGVNERGLYLINDDSITMSKIQLYADENIKQYSILSKQMQNIADKSEGIQSLRDEAINNPNSVKIFEGQISRLNEKEIVLKDSVDEFIRVGDDIFENIATESNLKHYVKLEKNNSEYYVVNTEKPTSDLKLSDYKYLETTTDKFTTVKKYLANQNLEEFNC
jgi:hypothetical protein